MQVLRNFFNGPSRWAKFAALAGVIWYTVQSWKYLHHLDSVLDEGAYLLKGWLFIRGVYTPFQDYGPLTNHTPLAFLIPGVIQLLFGPGLRPVRYFVLLVGIMILVGLWVLVRRLRGEGWAAVTVWVIALNPAVIKMYSVATSQVLIACMLVWMLVCILGEDRRPWQWVMGGILAGVAMMTRINLAAVLPVVVLYMAWQYGRKAALWTALAGGSVILVGHILYWPGILKLWTYWLPDALTPFLDPWREPEAVRYWNPTTDFNGRVISFFYGFRYHFVALWGALVSWILWPKRSEWKETDFRMAVFLSGLLIVLGAMHAAASLGLSYCIFCFPIYLSFFDFLGILLFLVALPSLARKPHMLRQILIASLLIVLTTGIAYSAFSDFRNWGEDILKNNVPRIANFRILPGTVKLWVLLENRFGWPYETQWRNLIPAIGLATGVGIVLISILIAVIFKIRKLPTSTSPGYSILTLTLIAGMLLSPTQILGNGFETYDCGQSETDLIPAENAETLPTSSLDVIQSYESAGNHLAELIPAGARVFWRGTLSAVPLLYLENPQLYPSQINQDYTLYLTGNDDELERYSFWSNSLAQKWVREADYVLVSKRYYKDWLAEMLEEGNKYEELSPTTPVAPCDPRSVIHIFKRNPVAETSH